MTDPRYLDATVEEMMTDYWAHYYYDNPKAREEIEDEDFSLEDEIARLEAEAEDNDPAKWVDVNK